MVLTLRRSALLSRSSSALREGKRGESASPSPTTSFSLERPRESTSVPVRYRSSSALIASFIEEDRQEADAQPDAGSGAQISGSAALKLRSAATDAKGSVLTRRQNAAQAAQHALAMSASISESVHDVSGEALETGNVGAVVAVVAAGGKPVAGTRWVEYVDDEDYVGTPYFYNLDTGESVWTPPDDVLASQQYKTKRLLAGMGMESFSEKARDSLVASFIEEKRKEQELAARSAHASAARKRRIAAREAESRRVAAAERDAERKAMEELLAAEEAARPPPAAPLTSILEASGSQNNALLQFARYLGMDPVEDQALLWIAKEAMLAPLPDGWAEVTDPATGDAFYHCEATGQSEWAHPLEAQYKALFAQIKRGQAERLQEVGSEGVKKTWGGDLIALHKHTYIKPLTEAQQRMARATTRGERRRREEELQARKERNRVRKERRIARVTLRVQRIWRSKRFRRQMETKGLRRAAAIILQAAGRGLIARRRVYRWLHGDLQREAATHIQRWARGYNLRRRMRGRMERLLFRRELRAKRRQVTAARAANAAWYREGGLRERIRCGEQGVLRKWLPPWEPLDVRAAAMRIQAAWRGWCGRAKAAEALGQLQQAVAEKLQQDASALEIQRHWRMWRQQRDHASIVPHEATDTSFSTERTDISARLHRSLDSRSPKGNGGRVQQSPHRRNDAVGSSIPPRHEVSAPASGNGGGGGGGGDSCEDVLKEDDRCSLTRDKYPDRENHQLPEAALVCARVLQLRKMGIQLLWLQPEPDSVQSARRSGSEITRLMRNNGKQTGLGQQLRPCRVAETVATAEHFFKHGETETALRHLSSVHAASTCRANEIQQSSAKVNDYATSEIRHSEYLSAVHCADSAAAMAMPPVLGLREAIDLTKRARGLLADQAMTANMTLRLAAEDEAAEAAELAAQEGWARRRDTRAEAFRQQQQARARSISAAGRQRKSDKKLMAMVSKSLGGKSLDATALGHQQKTTAEKEEKERAWLEQQAEERKQLRRATQRRAGTREAEVGACEHNLALLQMLLGHDASEWQQTLTRAVASVERAEQVARRAGAGQHLPSAAKIYISKIRKADAVLGRIARLAAASTQVEVETAPGTISSASERPSTSPSEGIAEEGRYNTWSSMPAFDASNLPRTSSCNEPRNRMLQCPRPRTAPSPFVVPAYTLPEDGGSRTARQSAVKSAISSDTTGVVRHGNGPEQERRPLCEVAANRSVSARCNRKVKQAAEFAARDRRIAARAARPRTAPVTRLLTKNKNALGVEKLMPDKRQLAEMERLSPRGTTALFDEFLEQRNTNLATIGGDRTGGQEQPPSGPERFSWTCHRANDCRRESGIFKVEMSVRKQTHRDRRGRRGAALSIFPG